MANSSRNMYQCFKRGLQTCTKTNTNSHQINFTNIQKLSKQTTTPHVSLLQKTLYNNSMLNRNMMALSFHSNTTSPNNLYYNQLQYKRAFQTSSKLKTHEDKKSETVPPFGEQMSLRLINENGFLSWTRNSYLSTAAGATILNGANTELMHHAGILVLLVSAMNMAWGSGCYYSNLLRIRDRIAMSERTLYLNLIGCVLHALLWLVTLAYYIHQVDFSDSSKQSQKPTDDK